MAEEEKKKTVTYKICSLVEKEGEKKVVCGGRFTAVYDESGMPKELTIEYPDKETMDTVADTAEKAVRIIQNPKIKMETYPIAETESSEEGEVEEEEGEEEEEAKEETEAETE